MIFRIVIEKDLAIGIERKDDVGHRSDLEAGPAAFVAAARRNLDFMVFVDQAIPPWQKTSEVSLKSESAVALRPPPIGKNRFGN